MEVFLAFLIISNLLFANWSDNSCCLIANFFYAQVKNHIQFFIVAWEFLIGIINETTNVDNRF